MIESTSTVIHDQFVLYKVVRSWKDKMMHCTYRSAWKALFGFLIAFVFMASIVTPSFADIAPPPPSEGFTILPGNETTQVRMTYENVFMNIDVNGVARVDANFVMRNTGNKEESMEVRFPLYSSIKNQPGDLKCGFAGGGQLTGSPIQDLAVWVWDKPQPVKTVVETMAWHVFKGGPEVEGEKVVMPCWGVFAVVFPPGLDVPIEVKYTSPSYSYILTTGAGWKGTIGQADITFRLPYEVVLGQSLDKCLPELCLLNGRDIQWKFNDFEPTENVSINMIKPDVWWRIITEINNLKLNPSDGQAWKRLAIAYRDSLRWDINHDSFINDPENMKHYQLSVETFQKAINLISGDSDLHLRYAQLLCLNGVAVYAGNVFDLEPFEECVRQLKQSLALDPQNKNALDFLQNLSGFNLNGKPVIRMNGPQPDYLILTPSFVLQSSGTPTAIAPTSPKPTQTPIATQTPVATFTPAPSLQPTVTPDFTPTLLLGMPTPLPAQTETGTGAVWPWALVPLAAILAVIVLRRRGGR
jgi:hypothetical protein